MEAELVKCSVGIKKDKRKEKDEKDIIDLESQVQDIKDLEDSILRPKPTKEELEALREIGVDELMP